MPLTTGARLGPYEIQSAIGAGGMGEVYRARDTRLDRTVAIKILPEALAADPNFRDRFDREARTISQLDHPNICALYDVGEAPSPESPAANLQFLVMQYLEGETLADRLARVAGSTGHGLQLNEALKIAIEIAGALDKAHRAGIVHRDLKPGNIMLTKSGAKLLDFGLAKAATSVVAGAGLSMLPTTPPSLTAQGTILGTFQYMAPEQLEGQEADTRTDIFAFGTVVYEMLTGKKAFEGRSHATLIAAIIGSDPPPISQLVPVTPPTLDRVVKKCLAKEPDARWQSAKDLCDELKWIAEGGSAPAAPAAGASTTGRASRVVWALAGVAVVSAAAAIAIATSAAMGWLGPKTASPAKVSFDINTDATISTLQISLSPDGARLATLVSTPQQGNAIWLRRLDEVAGQTMAGTAGAQFPFWSPDSRFLAFFASGKLNKIDVSGGPPQPLCDAPSGTGGTWNGDGVILFAASSGGSLFTVSSGGGEPVQATELDRDRGDTTHRHPKFLPDGNHFVFFVASAKPSNTGLYLGALDSKATTRLVASDAMGVFAPPDHLLFMRDTTLMAQRFDQRRLALEGNPFPVAQDVGINTANSVSGLAVSDTGVLAYRIGGNSAERILRWVDRTGKPVSDVGGVWAHQNVTLAPGGARLAETRLDQSGVTGDIWMVDLLRGSSSRFTFDPAIDDNAIWSPDGSQVVFGSARDGTVRNLYIKNAGGAGEETLLLKTDSSKYPTDWSRDGQYVLYTEEKGGHDVWVLPLSGDRKPIPLFQTPFSETRARFSPDGRWIAYTSYESGQGEVYVQSFPPSGGKWQISTSNGFEPHWRGDGRELFYYSVGAIWAVDVAGADSNSFKAGLPRRLFDAATSATFFRTMYDVAPDGQRFLLNLNSLTANFVPPVRVVVNWMTGLEK